jgi:CheY-like chemotaxis protein
MNGWELRAALREDPGLAGIPVIIVSALGEEFAEAVGATERLSKPVDIERLIEVVCEHCQ